MNMNKIYNTFYVLFEQSYCMKCFVLIFMFLLPRICLCPILMLLYERIRQIIQKHSLSLIILFTNLKQSFFYCDT